MRKQTIAQQWPCIFTGSFIKKEVDPVIKQYFDVVEMKPKFGDMRAIWRRMHCQTLNPYGSENCPFSEVDCGVAFLAVAQETLLANPRRFGALFRYVSRRTGAERADAAQGSRYRRGGGRGQVQGYDPALGKPAQVVLGRRRGSERSDDDVLVSEEEPLRGTNSRPHRIGSLLRSLDLGSRTQSEGRDDGKESTE